MSSKDASDVLIYGLSNKARSLDSLKTEKHCFLLGTRTLHEKNQIHQIQVNLKFTKIKRIRIYIHPHEIWSIVASPHQHDCIFTIYNTISTLKVSLWRLSDQLVELGQLSDPTDVTRKTIKTIKWHPTDRDKSILVQDDGLYQWDLAEMKKINDIKAGDLDQFETGCWHPHSHNQFFTSSHESIQSFDIDSNKLIFCIPKAHDVFVRDIDVHPNGPILMSGGDDGKVKYWDLRCLKEPIESRLVYQHWVTQVRFERFHGSLAISSGTCSLVHLWDMNSLFPSWTNIQSLDFDGHEKKEMNSNFLKKYEHHQDTIMALSWSASQNDPCFASLSYDGRLIVAKPSK